MHRSKSSDWGAAIVAGVCVLGVGLGIMSRNIADNRLYGSEGRLLSNSAGLLASRGPTVQISEESYFQQISKLLKDEYVNGVKDEYSLASGAVRGMILSLQDADCSFMNPDQYLRFQRAQKGQLEGIGVEFELRKPSHKTVLPQDLPTGVEVDPVLQIPEVVVASVAPGGPADKAGVKVGDVIDSVDGHWVLDSKEIENFRQLSRKVSKGELPATSITALRKEMRDKMEHGIMPARAVERLGIGKIGKVSFVVERGGKKIPLQATRSTCSFPPVLSAPNGVISLRFVDGAADALKSAISGKSALTIDLRNSGIGDFAEMKKCLAVVAPNGEYGEIYSSKMSKPLPVTVSNGIEKPIDLTLLVDGATQGPAEMFALGLASNGKAKLSGGKTRGRLAYVVQRALPDGSAYLLKTGEYRATRGGAK